MTAERESLSEFLPCGHPKSDETGADNYTFCAVCAVQDKTPMLTVARSRARYASDHIVVDSHTLCGLTAARLLPPREVENVVVSRMAHLCARCWHAANSGGVRTNGGLFDE